MTVLGALSSWYVQVIDRDWVDREQAACGPLPFPRTEYVAAWGGLALGVAAVVACVLLAQRIRRRCGVGLWSTRSGLLAYVSVWFNGLAIPFELLMLYCVYVPDPSGAPHCM
ncbi:hypothetical protein BLA24_15290 [Streptomyces cinnamoneus]|uniref:Uncharacterized protein n=2 Tax=Streptomyces cinnamoneus TaxID=53446 RepID=A0A2G1XIQ9_STRCJ|nr:hypothetical protein BLA24_15290 [Streptomyces cinnamoneus]